MITLKLLVSLKIPDVVALTAFYTLKDKMGYKDNLKSLKRSDYWEINVDTDDKEKAAARINEIIKKTNIFVNPNKHSFKLLTGNISLKSDLKSGDGNVFVFNVRVFDHQPDGTASVLQTRFGCKDITSVRRGILWKLEIHDKDSASAEKLCREIVFTKSRKKGLLINPHSQEAVIEAE